VSKGKAAILLVTIIWFSTLILLPPFGGRRLPPNVRDQRFRYRGNRERLIRLRWAIKSRA